MKQKTIQIIAALIINFILAWPLSYAVSISDINDQVTDSTALITWQTDESSKSTVRYGKTQSLDNTEKNNTLTTEHYVKLTNLMFNTNYNYKVESCDNEDKCNTSSLLSFTTENIPPPDKITNLINGSVTTETIDLKWDQSTSTHLDYYIVYRDSEIIKNITTNSFTDTELSALTDYSYQISAVDKGGNIGEKSDVLTVTTAEPDLTAPKITEVKIAALTVNSATITWTTDESSNSTLYYSETSALENAQGLSTHTINHNIQISGLTEEKIYYFKVESCDIDENCASSEISSFVPGDDVSVPTIEVTLPQHYNKKSIQITGTTKPYSEVKFYVNGVYNGMLSKTATSNGTIDIEVRGLEEGNNTIKIEAVDSHNLKTEKEFTVIVDTSPPQYTISSIPKLSKEPHLIISGTVSEPCTITFYSKIASGINVHKKVENFHSDYLKLTPNSVTLNWNELEDIDHYEIYREDIGLIGIPTKNLFVDNYAKTSTTYNYEIAAVYKDCSMGPKEKISVTTLDGGNENIRDPTQLQSVCGGITPKGIIQAEGSFTYSLGLNPGLNEVIINISDTAGNTVLIKNKTIHDSSPPTITYSNLDKLSPSYTKEVTIEGKVSEHSIVHVYIDEDEESSYKTETDEEGNFKIDIDLRRKVSGDIEIRQTSVNIRGESAPIWENNVKIIAVDDVGLESNPIAANIAYQICGQGGDWNIEIGQVTPDIIIPRLLLQGVSRIGFNVNYKWQGPGESKDATINDRPRITLRPLNMIDQEKFDGEFFGHVWDKHSNYYRSSYFLIDLKKQYTEHNLTSLEQENNLSNHNLGECIVPKFGCVKLPLVLEINYAYKDPYGTTMTGTTGEESSPLARRSVEQGIVYGTQRMCFNVEIAIDRRLPIDKILPKSLLKTMVTGINETINAIDLVLKPVDIAKKFAFVGCLGSWVVWLVYKFKEWTSCKAGAVLEGFSPNTCDPNEESDKGEDCASCLKAKGETIKAWEKIGWLCDRVMCPAAPTIQKYVRDVKSDDKRQDKLGVIDYLKERSHCEEQDIADIKWDTKKNDDIDKYYRDVDYYELEVRNVDKGVSGSPDETYCESEYIKNYDSVAIFMDEFKESYCLAKPTKQEQELDGINCGGVESATRAVRGVCEANEDEPRLISSEGSTYLIRKDETRNIRAAYEITKKEDISLEQVNDNYYKIDQSDYLLRALGLGEDYKGKEIFVKPEKKIMDESHCYIVDGSYNANAKENKNREYIEYDDLLDYKARKDIGVDDEFGRAKNDKWYMGNFKPQVCGRGKETFNFGSFSEGDIVNTGSLNYTRKNDVWELIDDASKKETLNNEDLKKLLIEKDGILTRNGIKHGYDNNKFETSEDCTSIPRAVWEEVCGDDAKDYAIDPTGDIVSSFQSGCLTGMSSYMTQYKTMLEMVKHCFEQLLLTGEGSSGVCKQFLSIYLCDLIYYAIKCVVEKTGRGYGDKPQIGNGVFGFLNYMKDGGANIQNSIKGRYGTSAVYKTMFVEQKLIHSFCALAFTGDFDLDLNAMVEAQIAAPIKTMCYINGDRRFAYADPQTGRATFLYNLGVFVVSGGSAGDLITSQSANVRTTSSNSLTTPLIKPIRYRVQLVCSNENSCQKDISETGNCDCVTYGGEQERRMAQGEIAWTIPVGDGTLEQGETLNEEVFYDKAINLPYRFDRARILISYVDNKGVEHIDEPCGETYLDGVGTNPPAMCKFDITEGFICEFEWGEFVTAYFDNVIIKRKRDVPTESLTEREEVHIGDIIELEGYVRKEGSQKKMEEQKVYLRYKLRDGYTELIDKSIEITSRNTDLETDIAGGHYAFPAIQIDPEISGVYKEDDQEGVIKVNPFTTSVNSNLALDIRPDHFNVDPDINIDKAYMINQIRISFTEKDGRLYYKIEEGCEGEKEGPYGTGMVCIATLSGQHGDTTEIRITGTPKKGETLTISNTRVRSTQTGDRRHLYLEISLHSADEYGQQDFTPLTYNRKQQKLTFDFYATKTEKKLKEGDILDNKIYWNGVWREKGYVKEDEMVWSGSNWVTKEEYDKVKEGEEKKEEDIIPVDDRYKLRKIFGNQPNEVYDQLVEFTLKTKNSEKTFKVHKKALDAFEKVNGDLKDVEYELKTVGSYNPRLIAGSFDLSYHAFGLAIDVNEADNPQCAKGVIDCPYDMPIEFIDAFRKNGFRWGGDYKTSRKDPMHFEWMGWNELEA